MSAKETGLPSNESLSSLSTSSEVPFLVTHWLANYNGGNTTNLSPQQKEAIEKIRKATSQIASAFTSLGAFGQSMPVSGTKDNALERTNRSLRDDLVYSIDISTITNYPFPISHFFSP